MPNRVNINITARDLTRGDIQRIRRQFNQLGDDIDHAVGNRTRESFDRLTTSVAEARRNLDRMRGTIPDDEFRRMDDQIRRASHSLRQGFGRTSDQMFHNAIRDLRRVRDGFNDLDHAGRIRIRVDDSALRRADDLLRRGLADRSRNRITIRPDVDIDRGRIRQGIDGINRTILNALGDTMSDGIGQALSRGFFSAMSNPYVASAIVALVAVIVMQIGTALAAALVLAFGGAFVAMGIMAIKGSKEVKDAFSKELKGLKSDFKEAAEPLIPVAVKAAKLLGKLGHDAMPGIRKAFKELVPTLNTFLGQMDRGFREFGKRAFDPMMDAFNSLLTEIDWEGFFTDLGDSFGHLGKAVKENVGTTADVFGAILSVIPKVINIIASLTEAWGQVQPFFQQVWETVKILLTPAVKLLGVAFQAVGDIMNAIAGPMALVNRILRTFYEEAIKPVADFIGRVFSPIWRGLIDGFKEGWVILETSLVPVLRDLWQIAKDTAGVILETFLPGITDLDEKAGSAGATLKDKVVAAMTNMSEWLDEHREDIKEWAQKIADGAIVAAQWIKFLIDKVMELFGWINRNWDLILYVTGISTVIWAITKVTELWNWFHRNWSMILKVSGIGGIIAIIGKVAELWNWIRKNWSFNLSADLVAPGVLGGLRALWGWVNRNWSRNVNFNFSISGAWDTVKSLVGQATGGVRGYSAAATGGVRSNMTMVGEQGPELVNLPPGSHVRSNSDSRRLMAGQGGGGAATIRIEAGSSQLDQLLLHVLRKSIRDEGGNVQFVLGNGRIAA